MLVTHWYVKANFTTPSALVLNIFVRAHRILGHVNQAFERNFTWGYEDLYWAP